MFGNKQSCEQGGNLDPKIAKIIRSLPDATGSQRYYKLLRRGVEPEISQEMCKSIGILISNFIEDIEKIHLLRTTLITYYH
jgi:hypothetical protein